MNGEKKQPFLAWALLILALFAVSSAGTILQSMEGIPPFLRASWRMQGTSLILFPLFIMQYLNKNKYLISKNDVKLLLISSIFLALHFGSWVWSLDNTTLVHSLLFVTMHPIIVVLLMPVLGSSANKIHIAGAFVGVLGAIITLGDVKSSGEVSISGDIAAFCGAITVVGYIFIGRYLRYEKNMPVFIYAFPVTLGAGVWLAIAAVLFESISLNSIIPELELFGWIDSSWFLWIIYLSIVPGLVGHTGINTVLRWIPPIMVSIVLLLEPVIGALIGWLYTGELILGFWTLLGGPLMLFGVLIVILGGKHESIEDI
jgi:drug/metabolite transporter (DMT)-like permease|tara:strand:+ start:525 stop:1469 length:945 start_codon:yes stop_codon:yes gene_type:complete